MIISWSYLEIESKVTHEHTDRDLTLRSASPPPVFFIILHRAVNPPFQRFQPAKGVAALQHVTEGLAHSG